MQCRFAFSLRVIEKKSRLKQQFLGKTVDSSILSFAFVFTFNFSSAYGQQDTRYQTYGQDYTQQYGAPAVDYSTSQADYSQHAQQSYDERAYAGYGKSKLLSIVLCPFEIDLVRPII